jgi:membrane protein implicated in regulation of membrane protease activity
MSKISPILTIVLFVISLAAIAAGVYLRATAVLTWVSFVGWLACTLTFAALTGLLVYRDTKHRP